jgi:hypothetical protein
MRLSDNERQLLADIERALAREDPRYVRRFTALPRRWHRWRRLLRRLSP